MSNQPVKVPGGPNLASYASKSKPNAKELLDFHTHADTDGSQKAIHHTLGSGHNQASPGDHSHDGGASARIFPLEGITISGVKAGNTALASVIAALVQLGAKDITT